MKTNRKQEGSGNGQAAFKLRVEFSHPAATAVAIAGTFNDWRPEATPMVAMEGGRWLKELVLPPGRYEYLLVADGEWLPDPQAKESAPNPFGGINSVAHVNDESQASGGDDPGRRAGRRAKS